MAKVFVYGAETLTVPAAGANNVKWEDGMGSALIVLQG
jgi:hypothetical protein